MKQRLVVLNERFSGQGWQTLRHGIGIHTGEVVAANIGSPERLSYLLVGDTVNLASRLQALTKEIGTENIVSADTHARLRLGRVHRAPRAQKGPITLVLLGVPCKHFDARSSNVLKHLGIYTIVP